MRVGVSSAPAIDVLSRAARRAGRSARPQALVQDGAHQRESVAVKAARREADQHVADADRRAVDHALAFDHADPEADELEVALRVDAGHRGGLAAEQRAARAPTPFGDAPERLRSDRRVELAHGEVVEEDQRLGALHDQVVHDHRHTVDADRVVAPEQGRELELRADAVRRGHQHRILVPLGRLEQPREAADAGQQLRPMRALRDLLDLLDEAVVAVEVTPARRSRRSAGRVCRGGGTPLG
jgi:hypothetical protein